ncbi:hypothetical protein SEPCBS57363_003458 [Sporothrix epigloea]|uniref:Uncharacterized protein n=1 Tax=Sporothrix epigloea TaxID=1892477 RepID=A0ABP0DNJ4_9PEZI
MGFIRRAIETAMLDASLNGPNYHTSGSRYNGPFAGPYDAGYNSRGHQMIAGVPLYSDRRLARMERREFRRDMRDARRDMRDARRGLVIDHLFGPDPMQQQREMRDQQQPPQQQRANFDNSSNTQYQQHPQYSAPSYPPPQQQMRDMPDRSRDMAIPRPARSDRFSDAGFEAPPPYMANDSKKSRPVEAGN